MAHRAGVVGSARGKQRVHQRAKGADRIGARMLCLPNYKHRDRTELTKIDVQIEVLEDSSDGSF